MKMKELREKSDIELDRLLVESRNKLRDMRFRVAAKQLSSVRSIREVRLTIAQALTLKKSRAAAKPAAAKAAKA